MSRKPIARSAANALLCAKITRVSYLDLRMSDGVTTREVLAPLTAAHLVTVDDRRGMTTTATLTEAGQALAATVTPDMLCGPLATSSARAEAAMWLWLLINGSQRNDYGSHDYYGQNGQIAHLLMCGVDLTKSGNVHDDTWSEWAGTLADDGDRVTGVSGMATCRCEEVLNFTVSHEIESVTALVRAVLAV